MWTGSSWKCSKNLKSSANFGIVRKPAESANFRRIPQVYPHFPLISIEQIVQTDLVLYVFCIGVIQQTISGHYYCMDTFLGFCNLPEEVFSVIQVLLVAHERILYTRGKKSLLFCLSDARYFVILRP